jgi:hypothetical protein
MDDQSLFGIILSGHLSQASGKDSLVGIDFIRLPLYQVPEALRPPPEELHVQIHLLPEDAEMELANLMKLTAINTSRENPVYLLDAAGFAYHARMAADPQSFTGSPDELMNWVPDENPFFYAFHAGGDNIYAVPLTLLNLPPELEAVFNGFSFYLQDLSGDSRRADVFGKGLEFMNSLLP